MKPTAATRRRFLCSLAGLGFGSTLRPGVHWAQLADHTGEGGAAKVTIAMLKTAKHYQDATDFHLKHPVL
jgi:hypothetical protein